MAEQPAVPDDVTPEQFFEQLMPMGFAAQTEASGVTPQDFTLQYHLAGAGGGDWLVSIRGGRMTARKGSGDANLAFSGPIISASSPSTYPQRHVGTLLGTRRPQSGHTRLNAGDSASLIEGILGRANGGY